MTFSVVTVVKSHDGSSMPPHGKVSNCVAIAIYVKNSLRRIPACSTQSVSLLSRA